MISDDGGAGAGTEWFAGAGAVGEGYHGDWVSDIDSDGEGDGDGAGDVDINHTGMVSGNGNCNSNRTEHNNGWRVRWRSC